MSDYIDFNGKVWKETSRRWYYYFELGLCQIRVYPDMFCFGERSGRTYFTEGRIKNYGDKILSENEAIKLIINKFPNTISKLREIVGDSSVDKVINDGK